MMSYPKLKRGAREYGTSKNIQSSINDMFVRNKTLFGSSSKGIYNYKSKFEDGGGWLDQYQNAGSTGVKKPYVLSPQQLAQAQANAEQAAYEKGLSKDEQLALLASRNPRAEDTIRAAEHQGKGSKAWEVITHPFTAATNLYQHGRLPDNFSEGPNNYLDASMYAFMAPLYAESIYNTAGAAFNPETYKNLAKTVRAGAHSLVGQPVSQEDINASLGTLGTVVDATLARSGAKKLIKGIDNVSRTTRAL